MWLLRSPEGDLRLTLSSTEDEEKQLGEAPVLVVPRVRSVKTRRILQLSLAAALVLVFYLWTYWPAVAPRIPRTYIQQWGIMRPTRHAILGNLSDWPRNPLTAPEVAFSGLGPAADDVYNSGPRDMIAYEAQLTEFINIFPPQYRSNLTLGLERYLHNDNPTEAWDADSHKHIWQTDKDGSSIGLATVKSWSEGLTVEQYGWVHRLLSDSDAAAMARDEWRQERVTTGDVYHLWNALPLGILKADLLRYLLLLLKGGIYSDTDTRLLRLPSDWGSGATVWKNGEGWMTPDQQARLHNGENVDDIIGRPSVVIGVEADVDDARHDWAQWWSRPLQIVQWTMAMAPYHPIALQTVLRVFHSTARAADWAQDRKYIFESLARAGNFSEATKLLSSTVVDEPKDGGAVGIIEWTGPGVWTDSALSYLYIRYGLKWTDLRRLQSPLRVGDVVILPVTGFSPGVGQFGAHAANRKSFWVVLTVDIQAMVWHQFRGSWKDDQDQSPMVF